MLRLAAIALLALSACTPSQAVPSPSLAPPSSPQPAADGAPADVKVNLYERGLSLEIPARWTWNAGVGFVNRFTSRYFLAANGPLTDLPVVPGNGDLDASALPTGRVVVAVEAFCGGLACNGPTTETPLPLDWSTATPLLGRILPSDRHELAIGFRWFDQPLFIVARWADDAPAADIAAIAAVARSISRGSGCSRDRRIPGMGWGWPPREHRCWQRDSHPAPGWSDRSPVVPHL